MGKDSQVSTNLGYSSFQDIKETDSSKNLDKKIEQSLKIEESKNKS